MNYKFTCKNCGIGINIEYHNKEQLKKQLLDFLITCEFFGCGKCVEIIQKHIVKLNDKKTKKNKINILQNKKNII